MMRLRRGKVTRLRLGADRQFGDEHAALGDLLMQPAILFGIDLIDPAREHGDRAAR